MSGFDEQLARWRVPVGYGVALAYLWQAQPKPTWLAIGGVLAAVGLVIRGAAAGHLRKTEGLTTSGPYARTRNPLYLGSVVLAWGLVVAGASWVSAAVVGAYLVLFYPAVLRREERHLRSLHGAAFEAYAAQVPRFWPRMSAAAHQSGRFSWALYTGNREYLAALGAAAGFLFLWMRMKGWLW